MDLFCLFNFVVNHLISFPLNISWYQENMRDFFFYWVTSTRARETWTHLTQIHKWVNLIWSGRTSEFLVSAGRFGTMQPAGPRRLIVFRLPSPHFKTSSGAQTAWRRNLLGWHPDQIASLHKKCNLWSITNGVSLSLVHIELIIS